MLIVFNKKLMLKEKENLSQLLYFIFLVCPQEGKVTHVHRGLKKFLHNNK